MDEKLVETQTEALLATASDPSGVVHTLNDIRFEKLMKRMEALEGKLSAVTAENAELRKANAELYTYASSPEQSVQPETVTPAQAVETPAAKAEEVKQKQTFDEALRLALQKCGYPDGQLDGM